MENDKASVLLRAYGRDSSILIDREMEAKVHDLLAEREIAAPLFARFDNGLQYGYVPGRICEPGDVRKEAMWRAVARRLGQWYGCLPLPVAGSERQSSPRTI